MAYNQIKNRVTFWLSVFVILIIIIKIFATYSSIVEKYYSTVFFQGFANILRIITGWIPFSLGDILYLIAGIYLLYKVIRFFIKMIKTKPRLKIMRNSFITVLLITMAVYIIFNIFWGLNYNRKGIAYQLQLQTKNYTNDDLKNILQLLIKKVNENKQLLINAHAVYPTNKELFARANKCYQQTALQYPFMIKGFFVTNCLLPDEEAVFNISLPTAPGNCVPPKPSGLVLAVVDKPSPKTNMLLAPKS